MNTKSTAELKSHLPGIIQEVSEFYKDGKPISKETEQLLDSHKAMDDDVLFEKMYESFTSEKYPEKETTFIVDRNTHLHWLSKKKRAKKERLHKKRLKRGKQ